MALALFSDLLVPSILQELVDRIKATAADRLSLVCESDIETELKNLEATYARAQRMLSNIDGWELISSKTERDWLADVRRACYDAEDYTEDLKIEILGKIGDANFLSAFFAKLGVSRKLTQLQSNLASSISVSNGYHNRGCNSSRQPFPDLNSEPVGIHAPVDASFRRNKDKDDVVSFFVHPSTTNSSRRLVILGMFGVGKTMLAQVVKNDPRIQAHFDYRLWVSVSGDFDLFKTLKSMIKDLQEEQIEEHGSRLLFPPFTDKISSAIRMFQKLCTNRQILVVLDDLRGFVKLRDWEDFESLLDPSSMFGIIITTRNPKVASAVANLTGHPTRCHNLQTWSDEDCVSHILSKVGTLNNINNSSKRKTSGKTTLEAKALLIAQKFCKGLPLVADTIGRRLPYEPEAKWINVDLWNMPEFREQIFPAFRLNYSDLSIFLKNSLPYFSLFPNNYNFNKDELIRIWMAEGFIRPQVAEFQLLEYSGLEQLGSYAFDEVLSQSILQVYSPFNQDPQIYRMHEFIHRYAQYVGSGMYVRIDQQSVPSDNNGSTTLETQLRKARHISFSCPSIPQELWKDIEKCEGLRTIISVHEFTKIGQLGYTLFLKLQWLRVLNLSRTDINELPESLGKLKHLGLLDVSGTEIEELPRSTGDLYGLQVLKLNECHLLLQLPKNMHNLTQLLHLEVDIKGLSSMPPHIGKLINLRTLAAFTVGKRDGKLLTELKHMNQLEGSICLTNLENVRGEAEANEAMLSKKPFLKRVELEWNRHLTDQSIQERVFRGLKPHENLEELQVTGYGGAQFPDWLSSSECKLSSIQFLRCDGCTILPPLGKLGHLKALHIEEMHRVKYMDYQFMGSGEGAGFPSLEVLKLQDMRSLEKWDKLAANHMPHLRDLVITDCPKLRTLPPLNLLTSLVNLELNNCSVLQALPEEGLSLSLQTLIIVRCELLKQCCLPEQGADWEKIKAIPTIVIDFKHISSTNSLSNVSS